MSGYEATRKSTTSKNIPGAKNGHCALFYLEALTDIFSGIWIQAVASFLISAIAKWRSQNQNFNNFHKKCLKSENLTNLTAAYAFIPATTIYQRTPAPVWV
jgi:hypothetical protein